jgi:dynactin 1
MAAASSFRLGQRVTIAGKGAGTIEFIGKTEFSDGKETFVSNFHIDISIGEWIGIVLDEPKGKNNGSVQKKGIFYHSFYI